MASLHFVHMHQHEAGPTTTPDGARRPGATTQDSAGGPAAMPGTVPVTRPELLRLQRAAGNGAVSALVQASPVVQRADDPPGSIAALDTALGRLITSKDTIIGVIEKMADPKDKATVLAGYKDKLAHALNFAYMKRAVVALGATLPVKLDWLQAASFLTSGIDYNEISEFVKPASQDEKNMLKNGRFKSFFISVCTNTTIFEAVNDLGWDLPTKLDWIRAESSALMTLNLAKLKPLLDAAPASEIAAVTTDQWLGFWTDVCTNATMAEFVEIMSPHNLTKKLEWMAAEGTNLEMIKAKVTAMAAEPTELVALYASEKVKKLMVSECNDKEMIDMVITLGGTWDQQKVWVRAEGASLFKLGQALVAGGKVADPKLAAFITGMDVKADAARKYLTSLSDPDLAALKGEPAKTVATDIINDKFGSDAGPILAAFNGQIATGEVKKSTNETLLAGDPGKPFKAMDFGGDKKFKITYDRDKVTVDVGVDLSAAWLDSRAKELLPSAKTTWSANILGAWNNKFHLTNDKRVIPMNFNLSLDGGPNSVTAHSGEWVWPKLNAGNWFVPDTVQQPAQADAVAKAPIHEFGHLIGNQDEYNLSTEHYVDTVKKNPATDPEVLTETDSEGKKRHTNTVSLMGSGTVVEPRHVKNILDYVNDNRQAAESPFIIV